MRCCAAVRIAITHDERWMTTLAGSRSLWQEALDYKYLIERPLQYDDDSSLFFSLSPVAHSLLLYRIALFIINNRDLHIYKLKKKKKHVG